MGQTVRIDDDVYAALLQISNELSAKENRRVSMSDAVRMVITFCPAVETAKFGVQFQRY